MLQKDLEQIHKRIEDLGCQPEELDARIREIRNEMDMIIKEIEKLIRAVPEEMRGGNMEYKALKGMLTVSGTISTNARDSVTTYLNRNVGSKRESPT